MPKHKGRRRRATHELRPEQQPKAAVLTPEQRKARYYRAQEMVNRGEPHAQIAESLGITTNALDRWFERGRVKRAETKLPEPPQDALDYASQLIGSAAQGVSLEELAEKEGAPDHDTLLLALVHDRELFSEYVHAMGIGAAVDLLKVRGELDGRHPVLRSVEEREDPATGEIVRHEHYGGPDIATVRVRLDLDKFLTERTLPDHFGNKGQMQLGATGELADLIKSAISDGPTTLPDAAAQHHQDIEDADYTDISDPQDADELADLRARQGLPVPVPHTAEDASAPFSAATPAHARQNPQNGSQTRSGAHSEATNS